ncbi:unnamed protein product [Musa banksii]
MALRFYDIADPSVFGCFLRISPPGYLRHSIPAVLLALSRLLFRLESLVLTFQGFRHGKRGSTREKALSGAIDAFEGLDLLKFVENNNGNETTSSFKKNKEQSTSKNYSPSGLPSLFWSL